MTRTYNAVDADGHVLEPPDLWLEYIDPKFRDRAPKLVVCDDGNDWLQMGEKLVGAPNLGVTRAGAVDVSVDQKMRYLDGKRGGFDPHARIKDMDLDGIDAVVLYPTLGLHSGGLPDADFAAAVCRAYNRWLVDYCKPYPDRLFGAAILPMQSVEHMVSEMRFARKELGLRSGFIRPNPYNNRLLSDRAYDPVWEEARDLDFALGIHEGTGGMKAIAVDRVPDWASQHIVSHTMEMMLACLNIIWGGVCERYPAVRFGFLESGGGWMPAWLDRMDRHFVRKGVHGNPALKIKPSEYFRRQCWIAVEPVEGTIAHAAEYLGANKILWATDYPHSDGFFPGAPQMVAKQLQGDVRRQVLAQGAIDFYKLN